MACAWRGIMLGRTSFGSILITALALSACRFGSNDDPAEASDDALAEATLDANPNAVAVVRRTAHGIPHIVARDTRGLAFGMARVYAEDNACMLADQIVTVRGERSKFFGPDESVLLSFQVVKNLSSDVFFKAYLPVPTLRAEHERLSADVKALFEGYVAGYNAFLSEKGDALPTACRGKSWVRPIELDDMLRLVAEKSLLTSAGRFVDAISSAAPPAAGPTAGVRARPPTPAEWQAVKDRFAPADIRFGSNGLALGRDATDEKTGMLLGNPHFPWVTTNRFYEVHFHVPKKVNVMGAAIGGFPVVAIGFNEDVAWTHTVSTALRFTPYELTLSPDDPTAYVKDGATVPLERVPVSVDVRQADGTIGKVERTLFRSEHGAVLVVPNVFAWSRERAYVLRDANYANLRTLELWHRVNRAKSVGEVREALGSVLGIPWVNTIAADRKGDALYADVGAVPNVAAETFADCIRSATAQAIFQKTGMPVLDGSRAACDWQVDPAAARPGLMPPQKLPAVVRTDYVGNSNDSYWLPNAHAPLEGFSPILGPARTARSLRTRLGFQMVEEKLAAAAEGGGAFSLGELEDVYFNHRLLATELALDDVLAICRADADAAATGACDVLAAWDRRASKDSQGAVLFRETWRTAVRTPGLWGVPFDATKPLETPRALRATDPAVAAAVAKSIKDAAALLRANGLGLDATLAATQFRSLPDGTKIGLPGGTEFEGGYSLLFGSPLKNGAYAPEGSAVSYLQFVTWNKGQTVADAVLAYGQSTDPSSPFFADQTRLYADQKLVRMRFREADIAKDVKSTVNLVERR